MGESRKKFLQSYLDRLLKLVEFNVTTEEDILRVAQNFEVTRKKWQQAELQARERQELLLRSEIECSALQVKLKHARNQVDVEMKRRQRIETELQTVERQMHLIRDLIQNEGPTGVPLSDSVLAFFGGQKTVAHGAGNRLSMVDESCGSFLSDISYDQTEDDLDLDELIAKPVKLKPRERRRSSLNPLAAHFGKKPRPSLNAAVINENIKEPVIAKTSALISEHGLVQAPPTADPAGRRRSRRSRPWSNVHDQPSPLPQINEAEQELDQDADAVVQIPGQTHVFFSKTMIRAEHCSACGHKTRFGKMSLKCRNCRILIHPECKNYCPPQCPPTSWPRQSIQLKKGQGLLADFAPTTTPMVPSLVVQCVNEIEKRGLNEQGLYRISGCEREVRDLKQRLLGGKAKSHHLAKEDVHTLCSVMKDFLRSLHEPLLTFSLHSQFLDAADILNDSDSKSEICLAVQDLPSANRDTLAFLILHLYRVMRSPDCKMDRMNLARVFGPTIVGHSVPDPGPLMIMQDTPRQAKVMSLLLSLPAGFWNQFLSNNQENQNCDSVTVAQERLFRPLTSPEINSVLSAPLKPREPYLVESTSKGDLGKKPGRFFTSPNN
ncbi:rac GTPase-activating protein 1-like [Hyperolius riggenbachi]|uniref:rac GTPase-activating protein 1-like n=1 Tax=Hyperolius riggenbachi TaxID=752182 RepID=UPI0035A367E5